MASGETEGQGCRWDGAERVRHPVTGFLLTCHQLLRKGHGVGCDASQSKHGFSQLGPRSIVTRKLAVKM